MKITMDTSFGSRLNAWRAEWYADETRRHQFATDGHFINWRLKEAWDSSPELRAEYNDSWGMFNSEAKKQAIAIEEAHAARVKARAKAAAVADPSISRFNQHQLARRE